MTQTVEGVRANLFAACKTLYAAETDSTGKKVAVSYGPPGTHQPNYIVGVAMETRQPITRPTMGTRRSRERTVEIDVIVSCYTAGADRSDPPAQQVVADAVDHLISLLEDLSSTLTPTRP
jgi:hypothetical protein